MAKRKATRRGNGEGSIWQRPDGRWLGQISLGYDEEGKLKRKTFYGKTRSEVSLKMTSELSYIMKNGYQTVCKEKFETIFMEWLLVFKRNTVQARTFERILSNAKTHVIPELGKYGLDEINMQAIQKMINRLYLKELSLDVIKKSKQIVGQFFEYAIDNEMAIKNPTAKIKIQKREKHIEDAQRYKAIPPDKRDEFIKALDSQTILKPMCLVMMCCGLRIGETLALTWRDVDIERKLIHINRAITVDVKMDKLGNVLSRKTVIGDTKTACSVRIVPVPDSLIPVLEAWKEDRWIEGKKHNVDLLAPDSLVFGKYDGGIRTYRNTQNIFDRFCKQNGFDKLGLHIHGLRQTYSNMLFEKSVNPKVIQGLLGHKDVKTTIMNYNSVDKSYFDRISNLINEQFK